MNGFPTKILAATDGSENATLAGRRSICPFVPGPSCTWSMSGRSHGSP